MKCRMPVLSAAALCVIAGTAVAHPPHLVKSNLIPTQLVPTSIAPIYIIDGVEVVGPEIPYGNIGPAFVGSRVVFDQFENNEDRGGPCGGPGLFFTANSDSASENYFHVRIAESVDDYKGMDPFGIGKPVTGVSLLWMHNTGTEGIKWTVMIQNGFNETGNTATAQLNGTQHSGVQVTFGNGQAMPAGVYYANVDWTGAIVQAALVDTDGGVRFRFNDPVTGALAAKDQPASWGTRTDELPVPMSLPRAGGQQNPIWYLNDNGALATVPYNLSNAISNSFTSADVYQTGPNTDPAQCFRSTGICWSLYVQDCGTVDAVTLSSPADGAVGVENNFPNGPTFAFTPGATVAPEYICQIKKNGAVVQSLTGQLASPFNLTSPLQAGQKFAWTIVSSSGAQCPSAESETFTFQMAGCAADYNSDDVVDFFDYLDFVDDFSQNENFADFNADQIIDFFDYLDFVDTLASGC